VTSAELDVSITIIEVVGYSHISETLGDDRVSAPSARAHSAAPILEVKAR